MLTRLPRLVLVVALAASIGLHWALLQSVAWVGMMVNYVQTTTLGDALAKTFDGKHPCSLCKAVADGKKSEKKPESGPVAKKFDFSYSSSAFVFVAPSTGWEVDWPQKASRSLARTPPVPPPRLVPG